MSAKCLNLIEMAALDRRIFENLHPGRRIIFNLPVSDQELVRFAVLDSAMEIEDEVTCAAMLVPTGVEDDWIYSSEGGQWQLLTTANVSRLIIVDRIGKTRVQEKSACLQCDDQALATRLRPIVIALAPRICFKNGVPVVPFVDYTHNIICRVVVEESYSSLTGSMVVEDVTLDTASFDSNHADVSVETGCVHRQVRKADKVVYRRRLRFKRMPNLVQTEVPLVNSITCDRDAALSDSQIDHSLLVHKYLPPIVAGLVLAASSIEPLMERGERVNVLALGVGGGALPIFLQKYLGFHVQVYTINSLCWNHEFMKIADLEVVCVQAVDIDRVVLDLAHRHFGLQNGVDMEVEVGDALQIISKLAVKVTDEMADKKSNDHRVHVIVLDVDEGDARCGLSSPPSSSWNVASSQMRGLCFTTAVCLLSTWFLMEQNRTLG